MTFSARLPPHFEPNRLSTTLRSFTQEGRPFVDLTQSNPTRAGFDYPAELLAPLAHPRGLRYGPEALGLADARRAVAADFARRGLEVPPDRIVLTASTSEAYSLLFKLLCNPYDEVLVPRPSYPLFEHLTRFEFVEPVPYAIEYHGKWSLDLSSVERALTTRTRAILVVSPNNPTGSLISPEELARLAEMCAPADVAIVADEVFADYDLVAGNRARAGHLPDRTDVLGFTLGGLSKSVGLPQVKLGWVAVSGREPLVRDALERLELLCDTYLSVGTPVQAAAPELFARGSVVRHQIQTRVQANYRALQTRVTATRSCSVLSAEGGWYGVVQVPSLVGEEELVLDLLATDHVLVHPGYFFDFASESYLVLSLIGPEVVFRDAVDRVLRRFDAEGRR